MNKRSVDKQKRLLQVWEETGQDLEQTARLLDRAPGTIENHLRRAGIRRRTGFLPIIDDETILRIWEGCGRRPGLAAARLGYHRGTVTRRLQLMGYQSKRGRPKKVAV
jgi:type II secretory pathway component PulJ